MRIFIPLLIFLFSGWHGLFAQATGKIDLKVTDQQQKPIDGALVQLVKAKDSSMTQYSITDQNGLVELAGVVKGTYLIYIAKTGFENYYAPVFTIDSAHLQINLPDAVLKSKSLNEVTVVAKTPMIQHFADKTVLNVQNSPLTAVGNVFDVIQHSPGVQVDQNDNISLMGKPNVQIMIDGRPIAVSGSDLTNILKSMPAESIDKIEFITNPSAKYDASGTAGIINIILKKDKRIGANATVYAGYAQGIYARTNDGFSFNDRTKKFNIFGSYNYSYQGSVNIITFHTNFYNGNQFQSSTAQYEYLKTPSIDNTARLGADFFASNKTTIGFIADVSVSRFMPSESTTTYEYDSLNNEKSYDLTSSNSPSTTYNYALNLNMKHTFDSTGRELLVNADYATYNTLGYQSIATNYFNPDNSEIGGTSYLYGYLPSLLNIYSLKADYDGQLGKKGSLGAGIKTSYVNTDNNLNIYDGQNALAPVDTTQSNHFIYSENINAGYVTYNRTMGAYNLQAGMRAEQTITNGDQVTTGQTFSRNFTQLFPNVSLNDSLSPNNQLGLSISRRVDRPTYNQLNPFSLYINPTFYLVGNPYLLPQNAYLMQLSDAIKSSYFFTLTYTRTQYPITTVIEPYTGKPNIVRQTEENLTSNDNYSFNFTVANQITSWWSTSTSVDAYVSHYVGALANSPLSTDRFLWDANTDNDFTISKQLGFGLGGFYTSGNDLGYLYLKPQEGVRAYIQIKVLKDKGTIKINAYDIFWTNVTNGITSFTGFTESVYVKRDSRTVGASFTYHLGGQSKSSLHSKGGAEDEKNRASKNGG